jgi:hypothetical protein
MDDAMVLALMQHSKRTRAPISELVQRVIQAWLGPEQQAICSNTEQSKDIKHLRGKSPH